MRLGYAVIVIDVLALIALHIVSFWRDAAIGCINFIFHSLFFRRSPASRLIWRIHQAVRTGTPTNPNIVTHKTETFRITFGGIAMSWFPCNRRAESCPNADQSTVYGRTCKHVTERNIHHLTGSITLRVKFLISWGRMENRSKSECVKVLWWIDFERRSKIKLSFELDLVSCIFNEVVVDCWSRYALILLYNIVLPSVYASIPPIKRISEIW